MEKQQLVLIGNGMAGVRCIEEILKNDPNRFEITIFGSEQYGNYNRILLSSVLQGDTKITDIILHPEDWYKEKGIKLFIGETAVKLDKDRQVVSTDKGREVFYDKVILATGSKPFILPIPGIDKEGVFTFRTILDCQRIMNESIQAKKAAVIGGGLLGLEAARGLQNLGLKVDVIHKSRYLMERQLDAQASEMLQEELERQGMNFLLEKESQEIFGNSRAKGIRFSDGTKANAEIIVMAAGVQPNCQLAKNNGIMTNRGILVNEYMQTNIPNIYAVGECAEHEGIVYGLVKPLYEQGAVLAKHICGISGDGYQGSVLSAQLKISGINVFSIGKLNEDSQTKAVTVLNEWDGVYKKMVFQENKMVGAVLYGDTGESHKLLDIILKKKNVANIEKGILLSSPKHSMNDSIASMKTAEVICNCNGVSKGTIIEAVLSKGLTTVDEIKKCTKASGSCGSCKPIVSELLTYTQSPDFDESVVSAPLCSCTSLTEDEIVFQMQIQNLTSVQEIMSKLSWSSQQGCSVCQPALRYYLGMIYKDEVRQEHVLLNEKMNTYEQINGTYSVTPQMYGGVTNPQQLRKIADVIEKYQVPKTILTSDQRIQLMGIKKKDLKGLTKDLNMRLSRTDSHGVQNVKTYIGGNNCGCEKQKSLELAVNLERITEFLQTPYRLKIGVTPCMHSDTTSIINDIGIICIQNRWELYVGGSDERSIRAGDLLYVAGSPEEVIDIAGGFIQYYRETANYLEPTWQWVDRVGLIHIREVLFDLSIREQLLERLEVDSSHRRKIFEMSFST